MRRGVTLAVALGAVWGFVVVVVFGMAITRAFGHPSR